jgi:hypothetical protein
MTHDPDAPQYEAAVLTCKPLSRRVLAVAKPGAGEDWAVYIAPVPGKKHADEVAEVVRSGTKQPRKLAVVLFPQFDPEKYRD